MEKHIYERKILSYVLVLKFCEINVYAGVHDSFWTHACDAEKMSHILREKFVELYNMPILENVRFCCIMRNFGLCYIPREKLFLSFSSSNIEHHDSIILLNANLFPFKPT